MTSQLEQFWEAQAGNVPFLETVLCSNYKAVCQLLIIEDIKSFSNVAAESEQEKVHFEW